MGTCEQGLSVSRLLGAELPQYGFDVGTQ